MFSKKSDNKKYRLRIFVLGFFFFAFSIVIYTRAYYLQYLENDRLNRLASSQYTKKLVVSPKRGTIYDRNGEVLAIDVEVASIGLHPHLIKDKVKIREKLLKHTGISAKDLDKKLNSSKRFEWIKRRIPRHDGVALKALKDRALVIETEFRRYYPNKKLASHVIGAVGFDAKALGGIELTYDSYLKTQSIKSKAAHDAKGRLLSSNYIPDSNHDIYLTIDKHIQQIAESALQVNALKHKVKSGFAIVMHAKTGEILAMANYPQFDPNRYWQYPMAEWKNHAVIDTFEPGSTFKTFLIAAAFASGKVKPQDKFNCENGSYRIGKYTINDHDGHGLISAREILKVSSNIGVTKIAEKIGADYFYNFLKKLGFGQKTQLGFIGEISGILRHYQSWKRIGLSNVSFGQGLTVNAIQMLQAYSAVVNGGNLMKPILIRQINDAKKNIVVENEPTVLHQMFNEKISEELRKILFLVTQTGGTARSAHVDGYLAGGKTGTAQKVDPHTKRYAHGSYISSFIGFTPLKDPEILIYVVYDSPKNGYYGGIAAAPVFKDIAEKTLAYLTVTPQDNTEFFAFYEEMSGLKNKNKPKPLAPQPKNKILSPEETADKPITPEQYVEMRDIQIKKIHYDLSQKKVPDLRGLTFRKVLQITQKHGLYVDFKGSGIVVDQLPKPGMKLDDKQKLQLILSEAI